MTGQSRSRSEWMVVGCFGLTTIAGLALLGVYIMGGQTQVEGVLLAVALGGLGIGIVIWAHDLMVTPDVIEERHEAASSAEASAELTAALDEEAGFSRRRLLIGMLLTALSGLGAALAIPALSLGPVPGPELFNTTWRQGRRLVGIDGLPVRADSIPIDSLVTVFPEGDVGSAQTQTLLIRVPEGVLRLDESASAGAPAGFVAYSKVCTHAGCPVGLYRAQSRQLICPCHQSTFDVPNGAKPVYGPAARALPQLPIRLEPDGTFVAVGDFSGPVGPTFWYITSDGAGTPS